MCFSAEASFVGATVIGTVGLASLTKLMRWNQIFLILIPFLFAFQQLVEGLLWLTTDNLESYAHHAQTLKNIFLFIAIFVWPILIPLSLLAVEEDRNRGYWLSALLAIGIVFDLLSIYGLIFWWPLQDAAGFNVFKHSIEYQFPATQLNWFFMSLYVLATLAPPFFSSLRGAWLIGAANVIGFLIAHYFFTITSVSVWCFFAAWVSVGVYLILHWNSQPRTISEK